METKLTASESVMLALLKEPLETHTATSLAKSLGMTRQGLWKVIHKLTGEKLVTVKVIGQARNSITTIHLNWPNPVTEKALSLLLTKESVNRERWMVNFAELGKHATFLILFGSILHSPRDAQDIDIIAVVSKKGFKVLEEALAKVQQTQLKKIHLIDVTKEEFSHELKSNNNAYAGAVKKGIVLSGQENFIYFMKEFQR